MQHLFDGKTYNARHDQARLSELQQSVYDVMEDGRWRTIWELQEDIGWGSETGVSAKLRDLRKPQFGGHEVDRRRSGDPKRGVWEYRLRLR